MARHIYGSMPDTMPEGYAKAINFPVLMMMDTNTGDGRVFASEGGSVREGMPHPISTMMRLGYGHEGAVPSGALFEITLDDETKQASGRGFLLDDEAGLTTARYVATKALNKFSVRVADVKVQFVEDFDSGEYWVNFSKWAISAGSFVETPGFKQAYGEITAAMLAPDDEIMASLLADPMAPLKVECGDVIIPLLNGTQSEIVADGSTKVAHELFFRPESPVPTKMIVTEANAVYGHPALWNSCHEGLAECVMPPRPKDGYASANLPGVLTDRGMVGTVPVFWLGGHKNRSLIGTKTREDVEAAYGGVENCWADVHMSEGIHGPWASGIVRPGVTPETIYAARASRVSGHWLNGELKAIVSVLVPGYDVPGDPAEMTASFAEINQVGDDVELIASFPGCMADGTIPTGGPASGIDRAVLVAVLAELGVEVKLPPEKPADEAERLSQQVVPNPVDDAALQRLVLADDEDDDDTE